VPDREALGLTSVISPCDCTESRFRVLDDADCVPFKDWWPHARVAPNAVSLLTYPPKEPAHWWVSEVPVPVVRG
jgi:hypothetical protein